MATRIQVRRDTTAAWNSVGDDPTARLSEGEFGYDLDQSVLKIGPGTWNDAKVVLGTEAYLPVSGGNIDGQLTFNNGNILLDGPVGSGAFTSYIQSNHSFADYPVEKPSVENPVLLTNIAHYLPDQNGTTRAFNYMGGYFQDNTPGSVVTTSWIDFAGTGYFGRDVIVERDFKLIDGFASFFNNLTENNDLIDKPSGVAPGIECVHTANYTFLGGKRACGWAIRNTTNGIDRNLSAFCDWKGFAYFDDAVNVKGFVASEDDYGITLDKSQIIKRPSSEGDAGFSFLRCYAGAVDDENRNLKVGIYGDGSAVFEGKVYADGAELSRVMINLDPDNENNYTIEPSAEGTSIRRYTGPKLDLKAVILDLQQKVNDRDQVIASITQRLAALESAQQ